MNFKKNFIVLVLLFIVFGLVSCKEKEPEPIEKPKIASLDSFTYEITEEESGSVSELAYSMSFQLTFSIPEEAQVDELKLKIQSKKFKRNLHFTLDYINTENVTFSSSAVDRPFDKDYPYVILNYEVPNKATSLEMKAKLKITTTDLMDDVNKFIELDYTVNEACQILDYKGLASEGKLKMSYSSDAAFYFEFDEFSESYRVVSIHTDAKEVEIPSTYLNHPVKDISWEAFTSASSTIEKLVLPSTLTSLPEGLLGKLENIKSLSLPLVGTCFTGKLRNGLMHLFSSNTLIFPESLEEVIVTGGDKIPNYAFENCSHIKKISMADSITSIGRYSFSGCSSLEELKLSPNITKLDEFAFKDCAKLTSIAIYDNIVSIGDHAFSNCSQLTEVTLGKGVTVIGESVFSDCIHLKNIVIPENITEIANGAFSNCSELESVTISNPTILVDEKAFIGCNQIKTASIPILSLSAIPKDNLEEILITSGERIGKNAFLDCKKLKSITLADSILHIESDSFAGCDAVEKIAISTRLLKYIPKNNLKEVTLTSGIELEDNAFLGCSSLEKVILPYELKSIGLSAFRGCENLEGLLLPNSVESIGENAFEDCNKLIYYMYDQGCYLGNNENPYLCFIKVKDEATSSCILHENTKIIYSNSLQNCVNLKNVVMPDHLTEISEGAFANSGIESIILPSQLKTLGASAFSNCKSLETITIPNGVTTLEVKVFSGCEQLKTITLGNQCTTIENGAFEGCKNLESINFPKTIEKIGATAFTDCERLYKIYYEGTIEDWCKVKASSLFFPSHDNHFYIKNQENWEEITQIEFTSSITSIGQYQFNNLNALTKVIISKTVSSIGEFAFSGCKKLTDIYYEGTIEDWCKLSLGVEVFDTTKINHFYFKNQNEWEELTTLELPEGITSLGNYQFYGWNNVTSIILPNSLTSIGARAFYGCSKITTLTLPEGIKSLGTYAFGECDSLESITLPNSITKIDNLAFFHCISLKAVTLPSDLTKIGYGLFANCSSLEHVILPNKLTSLERRTFYQCKNLLSIILPSSVASIGAEAFSGCSSLASVILPNGMTSIGASTFYGCSSLTSITLPDEIEIIDRSTFNGCSGLNDLILSNKVRKVEDSAFFWCMNLQNIYYKGDSTEWNNKIKVNSNNNANFISAEVYFYSEEKPASSGNYWHYVEGIPTKW